MSDRMEVDPPPSALPPQVDPPPWAPHHPPRLLLLGRRSSASTSSVVPQTTCSQEAVGNSQPRTSSYQQSLVVARGPGRSVSGGPGAGAFIGPRTKRWGADSTVTSGGLCDGVPCPKPNMAVLGVGFCGLKESLMWKEACRWGEERGPI